MAFFASKALLVGVFGAIFYLYGVDSKATIHTVFTTECGEYFSWQSMGMIYSHRKAGQEGPLTRIMCCTPEEYDALSDEAKSVIKTHVAPSYTHHPRTGDVYSAYNKPVAVIDWLARNDIQEDYVLIIDADMIMREPFIPEVEGARPGRAVSAYFGYMKGVNNKLALKHVPEVLPRNDTLAGPHGRRGDQVGGFTLMHTDDLRRVAPLWLKYTEDVRADPDAWELTGDAYSIHPGDKPWISEMYGYSFACSKSDVWHICHRSAMLYPAYEVMEPPKVLHYGLYYEVANTQYKFDKHWHYDFNPFKCPPWNLDPTARSNKGGLFPHPPRASSFRSKGNELLRDLLAIEVPVTLNAAFCEHHRANCPPSEELEKECRFVDEYAAELDAAIIAAAEHLPDPCHDNDKRCAQWMKAGECENNAGYMMANCPLACKACKPRSARGKTTGAVKEPELNSKEDRIGSTIGAVVSKDGRADLQKEESDFIEEIDGVDVSSLKTSEGANSYEIQTKSQLEGKKASRDDGGLNVNGDITETKLADEEEDGLKIPELKLRCTRFPKWSVVQVKKCMLMASNGIVYDPTVDDPVDGMTSADLHAQAHRLIDRTHDVGKLLGDRLSKIHIAYNLPATKGRVIEGTASAASRIGPAGMLAWALGTAIVLALIIHFSCRRRRAALGKTHHMARQALKFGRTVRDD